MKNWIIGITGGALVLVVAAAKFKLMEKDSEISKIEVKLHNAEVSLEHIKTALSREKVSFEKMKKAEENCKKAADSHEKEYNSLYNLLTKKEQREERLRSALQREKARKICEPGESVCPEMEVLPEVAKELNKQNEEFER